MLGTIAIAIECLTKGIELSCAQNESSEAFGCFFAHFQSHGCPYFLPYWYGIPNPFSILVHRANNKYNLGTQVHAQIITAKETKEGSNVKDQSH